MKKKNIIIIIIVITIILVIGYILFFKDINQSNNVEEIEVPDGGIDMVLKKYYEIANKELKRFEKYARKYGINYAVKKDKSKDPPVYLVFFKGRDRAAIDAAFRDFTGEQLRKKNKNRVGIRKKLALYRAAAKNQKKARDKNRQQVR